MLDERAGVSYPDGQQDADGVIHLIYNYNRSKDRHILFASFREEDAAKGKAVTDAVKLRQMVSDVSHEWFCGPFLAALAITRGGTRLISKTICDTAAFGGRFFVRPDQPLLRGCTSAR